MKSHRKSRMGQNRDIGTGNNGKGDGDRTTDTAAYSANYDAINWGPASEKHPKAIINPEWVNAGPGADIVFPVDGFRSLNTDPNPALEDFESWDR